MFFLWSTQPLGTPEISKKSLSECSVDGGIELFIIGKNFLKDAKVIWKSADWTKVVEPDKEFLHPVSDLKGIVQKELDHHIVC